MGNKFLSSENRRASMTEIDKATPNSNTQFNVDQCLPTNTVTNPSPLRKLTHLRFATTLQNQVPSFEN